MHVRYNLTVDANEHPLSQGNCMLAHGVIETIRWLIYHFSEVTQLD